MAFSALNFRSKIRQSMRRILHRTGIILFAGSLACGLHPVLAVGLPDEPILRIDPGEHTAIINRIAADEAGHWLVTASMDKTARVRSLADGRLAITLRPPIGAGREGQIYAVAITPDGRTVAVGGWTQFDNEASDAGKGGVSIYLFDRASGRIQRRLDGLPDVVTHLAFSPDGRNLAATLAGRNGLRLFSVADGSLIAEDRDYGGDSYSVHFSRNGSLVTTCYDGHLRLYRFDSAKLTKIAQHNAPGGTRPYSARFSPDGKRIGVGFKDSPAVNVLDGDQLNFLFAPDTAGINGGLGSIDWSQDGAWLYAAGQAQRKGIIFTRRWAIQATGSAGKAVNWPVAKNAVLDITHLPGGRLAFGSAEPAWGVLGVTGERQILSAQTIADFRGNINSFNLSRDGSQVGFSYESGQKPLAVFDALNRAFLPANVPGLTTPNQSSPGLAVTGWEDTSTPKLNGAQLKLQTGEMSRSLAVRPNGAGFVLGADWNLYAFDRSGQLGWKKPVPGTAWAVNISQDGRWVVAAYGDGTIRWHRASDGAEQLAFYPHPDKKRWVMWTPSGYYDANPGAEDLIGWHLNRGKDQAADFFPASRFRKTFYRPDVIAKIFETADDTKALQLAKQESGHDVQAVSITQVLPPVVEILLPQSGLEVSSTTLALKVSIRSPSDAPVTATRVRVNGLPQTAGRNQPLKLIGDTREITVTIPQQDAEIQVFAENKNGVSTPATINVTWAGKKAVPAQEDDRFKPKLYVLAVGVSKYQNPDYNLDLAAKDARDLAAVFEKQSGKLYSKVIVRLLTDDKATKDEVLGGLEWLKREVTSRDVGVMFLAGHGMNDNTGNYYFLPHNVDVTQLVRTGIAQNDIKITLNALAGKAIFFVDSCHSGNALGTAKTRAITDVNAFVSELASAENGVIVFTASTGRQLSQESASWGNGAFTKAVVEGLNGKADFQKNGKITHKGLDYYVTERVKALTNGQQSPVSIAPGGVTDFPIAVITP